MRKLGHNGKIILLGIVAVIITAIFISSYFGGLFLLNRNDYNQLELIGTESSQYITSGQNLSITIEIYNKGPDSVFNVSNNWPTIGGEKNRLEIGPCSLNLPYGFAVVPGNFNRNSIITSKPINIWKPGIYMCPALYNVKSYQIVGLSDIAYLIGSGNPPIEITLNSEVSFSGYWVTSSPFNGTYHFVPFPAGQYTIIVADEWGAYDLLHFTVT